MHKAILVAAIVTGVLMSVRFQGGGSIQPTPLPTATGTWTPEPWPTGPGETWEERTALASMSPPPTARPTATPTPPALPGCGPEQ